jgi:hypothetical protein
MYGPAAIPTAINPKRILHNPVLKEVNIRARPDAMLEKIMVLRWDRRVDINPDASNVVKYPNEIKRKREPASALLKARSVLTLGIRGAKTIRDIKFTKKMEVSSKSGGNPLRKVSPALGSLSSMSGRDALVVILDFRIQIMCL